ncbi:MAG: DNA repair protein RadA [Candidatus Magasanikbacteria bacterium RIFOXYA2_FULL_44_8]|uniref:DNA repair protein RadA n=1 Tax=Candidatus Magasanikbacteria bacterium RIFOXYA2_FULL_44_8 TaxID=1798696 RepID=A0A1F6NLS5_9BACT|nr:MAG: DNA repair protein RadA [Candidatus Magasanikbacteria bacterium RIFOXYA2_FULL_44_8]
MSKQNTIFTCSHCSAQFQKWNGRCLECGQWGTVEKSTVRPTAPGTLIAINDIAPAKTVGFDELIGKDFARATSGIGELDRVLGGGLVPGSVILLGGEPGIGKSTLALQIATTIPNCLYISGEESADQIKLRADRLKITDNKLRLAGETNVETIVATISHTKPTLTIVDSIQTVFSSDAESDTGSSTQVRACATKLMQCAKMTGRPIIIIGQVTKDGGVAGPKTLEHLVDTVLYLEGDKFHNFRILRAVKNRFGSTDEVGVFSMEENGLCEVANPSQAFLSGRPENIPGSAITCLMEGTRPILVEIQALVTKTNFGYPQRRSSGFDLNRLQVLIGVLTKRAGLPLDAYDVFLNVVGGMQADEPAADLAVALALASAFKNKQLPANLVSFGEIGLGGELRGVPNAKRRLEEIKKLGFAFAAVPSIGEEVKIAGIKIAPVKNVAEVVEKILEK